MESDPPSSYDELPYGDNCFAHTHPDYLATIARIFGIDAPDPSGCRVLELGCAGGGNLIPMALELPGARFVGVDLSPRQVEAGRAVIRRLGLGNIALEAMSIADVGDRFGPFDYVVCHGVYSWVPEGVREAILQSCSANLTPNGVAYVSYNTYPGWHARGMVREMLAFHVRGPGPAVDRVRKAREFLDELVEVLPDGSSSYARILRTEGEFLRGVPDSYLFHEHLEETNHPVYFRDFIARAEARGLRFLAEARAPGLAEGLPDAAREAIGSWAGDEVAAEQYLDFLCNRTFRRTLLCRADRRRSREPSASAVASLWVGTEVAPASAEVDVIGDAPEAFRKPDGAAGLTTNNPLVKAALAGLHQARPRPIPFDELLDRVRERLGRDRDDPDDADGEALRRSLLRCFLAGLVELHAHPPAFATAPGPRPSASPLARLQAEDGARVTNLRRRSVDLGDFDRVVLRLLDGARDLPAILHALVDSVESGDFSLYRGDQPIDDRDLIRSILRAELGPCLERLAGLALLSA